MPISNPQVKGAPHHPELTVLSAYRQADSITGLQQYMRTVKSWGQLFNVTMQSKIFKDPVPVKRHGPKIIL
jgi:hypothetical protein